MHTYIHTNRLMGAVAYVNMRGCVYANIPTPKLKVRSKKSTHALTYVCTNRHTFTCTGKGMLWNPGRDILLMSFILYVQDFIFFIFLTCLILSVQDKILNGQDKKKT